MKHWMEVIKPNFTGPMVHPWDKENSLDGDCFVTIPGISSEWKWTRRLGNDFLAVSADTIKGIFDPFIQEVEDLVEHQMNSLSCIGQTPKALLLVGGLGSSEYLFRRLQKRYTNIDILQPSNAWSAVVHDNDPHGHETYWWELEEMWRIRNCMEWYIRKRGNVSEYKPIKMPLYRVYAADRVESNPDCLLGTETLYVWYNDKPPEKWTTKVFRSCGMSFDLRGIPAELFEKHTNSKGTEYYKVNFEVHMTPKPASILFELVRDGKTYGAVYAKY